MTRSTTFFLADDDADDRQLMIEAIKTIDPSIKIVESENGQELLNVLQSQAIFDRCLIILDMNMPKMNGLETLSKLRDIPHLASLPTIIVSTVGNPELIDFAKKLGAIDYLIKPSTMDGLINLSRQLVFGEVGHSKFDSGRP
ncbi:response regulator [Dyadobacter sp. CY107]|uniref:response regulator n=1 Tax=Dyadobacter fanqingshengii TaxID=2906443 RepID=UPI001F22BC92|nr:response regulator [Dyadobacter fanqingshengii]MCF2502054.1 response regulator [Dyadobacter fanqingshengii]